MLSFTALVGLFCFCGRARCHELCKDGMPPMDRSSETFHICEKYQSNSCCTAEENQEVFDKFEYFHQTFHDVAPLCKEYVKEIFCQECSPKSAHLFTGPGNAEREYAILCTDFCAEFLAACPERVRNLFGKKLCNTDEKSQQDYCFPKTNSMDGVDEEITQDSKSKDGDDCVSVCLKRIIRGVKNIVDAAFPPDGTDRLFLVQQDGIVWELTKNRQKIEKPFLDITSKVHQNARTDERGLLSMAFHPQFSTNGLFYVFYNPAKTSAITCRVSEMKVKSQLSPMEVDQSYERTVLQYEKPESNHNGGQLLFGNDGYMYITTGDGGGGGDKHGNEGNGQDLNTFLGKILRIDVDNYASNRAYGVPGDNPFTGDKVALPEIYAYGFRNPWRASVDRKTGEIFVGDVGQKQIEEVDIVDKGRNYGWRAYEGPTCYDQKLCKKVEDTVMPIFSYNHSRGNSVIGGFVYRGSELPHLEDKYIFGDMKHGQLLMLERTGDEWRETEVCVGKPHHNCPAGSESGLPEAYLFAFGEDEKGELYMFEGKTTSTQAANGAVYRLVKPID